MQVHECVSFIVMDNSNVLLEKRAENKETDPGLITIPGGHIEPGETKTQALFREMEEELNIVPVRYQYLCSLYHPTSELQLIHYYMILSWDGEVVSSEAEELEWHSLSFAKVGIGADSIALREVERIGRHL